MILASLRHKLVMAIVLWDRRHYGLPCYDTNALGNALDALGFAEDLIAGDTATDRALSMAFQGQDPRLLAELTEIASKTMA